MCASSGGFATPIKGYNKSDIAFSLIPSSATFQCTSKTKPFYVKFKDLSKRKYAIYAKDGVLDASRLSNSAPQNAGNSNMSLKEMLANKLHEQIGFADINKQKYILAVSETNPVMSITDMNYATEVHWIYKSGQCDQIATVTKNTDTHSFEKIENYFRCGTSLKELGNSSLLTVLPESLRSKVDIFFDIIKESGYIARVDSFSGITVIGRRVNTYNTKYLYFFEKNNKLIHLVIR